LILTYLSSVGEHKLNFWGTHNNAGEITLPDPDHRSMILPPGAKKCQKCYVGKHSYSCHTSNQSNSLIQFYEPVNYPNVQKTCTGAIYSILKIPLDNILRTFLLVRKHHPLEIQCFSEHPELMSGVVSAETEPDLTVIEPWHVITHLSAWKRPREIYNTDETVVVICWALNRGRR
jgi:hypothetical protein